MQSIIFFILSLSAMAVVLYLGVKSTIKGFKAKNEEQLENENNLENNTVLSSELEKLNELFKSGALSKEEFDALIYDLTNFLVYVGEPIKATRERIGWYVVFYFLIFTALASLLYREYHKDYN